MLRYTLHVPLFLNDGTPTPEGELDLIERELLDIAGGFTATDGIGAWQSPDTGRIYREPVRLYHVDSDEPLRGELAGLVVLIGDALKQEAVYVTTQRIAAEAVVTNVPA